MMLMMEMIHDNDDNDTYDDANDDCGGAPYHIKHTYMRCMICHASYDMLATESALNDLEGYLYKVKNTIADKEDE